MSAQGINTLKHITRLYQALKPSSPSVKSILARQINLPMNTNVMQIATNFVATPLPLAPVKENDQRFYEEQKAFIEMRFPKPENETLEQRATRLNSTLACINDKIDLCSKNISDTQFNVMEYSKNAAEVQQFFKRETFYSESKLLELKNEKQHYEAALANFENDRKENRFVDPIDIKSTEERLLKVQKEIDTEQKEFEKYKSASQNPVETLKLQEERVRRLFKAEFQLDKTAEELRQIKQNEKNDYIQDKLKEQQILFKIREECFPTNLA